jgi:hypothetical protein
VCVCVETVARRGWGQEDTAVPPTDAELKTRRLQTLSTLRQKIHAMNDDELGEFMETFGDAIIESTSREIDR